MRSLDESDAAGSFPVSSVRSASSKQLLRSYAEILTELVRRGVVRSRNAPAGDLAETLVAAAYAGTQAPASEKSWDVAAGDRRLQVKCRVLPGPPGSATFSPFRSWDFDACVFVIFDAASYDIVWATELSRQVVQEMARHVSWVAGHRVSVYQVVAVATHGVDVTDQVREALEHLDEGRELG